MNTIRFAKTNGVATVKFGDNDPVQIIIAGVLAITPGPDFFTLEINGRTIFTFNYSDTFYINDVQVTGAGADPVLTLQELTEQLAADVFNSAGGSSGSSTPTEITYAELLTAIAGSTLTPGAQYIITDFATKHYVFDGGGTQYLDTIITGTTEPLLVTAIAANKLSHEAKSALYPQDIIHYDPDFSNWDQDIAFADLTDAENPVAVTGFKGVIYFRHDTLLDNYMPYDFRNCKFRRWNDGTGYYGINSNSTGVTDANDYLDQKTFVETGATGLYEICCRGNHFESFKDSNDFFNRIPTLLLNHIVYLKDYGWYTFICNTFGAGNYSHTFKGYTENIVFAQGCYEITLGDNCYNSSFGQYCNRIICGSGFNLNTFAQYVQNIDLSSATHVYASYNCTIFKRADLTAKLSYVDNTDTQIIVNANA